jgi:hypothetical protein
MQTLRIVLVLISIGCILGPVGAVMIMYRSNLSQVVLTPQLQQLMHFGNNNNSNNNGNNNNNNNNNNSNNNNNNNGNNNGSGDNSGSVNNNNSPVINSPNSFGGSGQFDVTVPNSESTAGIDANINCLISQNGNNIQLGLDLTPTSIPSSLQSTFNNNDILLNFDGTTSNADSGTQINANAQGSLSSGSTFDLNLNGTIDQSQDTLTFTITSAQNSQTGITTPQAISLHPNSGNNDSNNSKSNNGNNSNNNNNSGGVSPVYLSGQVNTVQKTITLTFSINNGLNHDTTINSMSGTLEITADQYSLGAVSSSSPVTIPSGQTVTLTVSGTLTQNGLNNLNDHYSHVTSLDVTVVNGKMTEDGVTNQGAQSQDLGDIAISW